MTNLDVDLDVGYAVIENCRVNGTALIDVDAGNVEVNESEIFILKGDVDAGNMRCHLKGSTLDSYNMELDTDLGNIIKEETINRHQNQMPKVTILRAKLRLR